MVVQTFLIGNSVCSVTHSTKMLHDPIATSNNYNFNRAMASYPDILYVLCIQTYLSTMTAWL